MMRFGKVSDERWYTYMVGAALALWTACQFLFVHSALLPTAVPALVEAPRYCHPFVLGFLIVPIIFRRSPMGWVSRVLYGVGIFVALMYRFRAGDNRLIVLMLFLMAARNMDFRVLIVFFGAAVCLSFGLNFVAAQMVDPSGIESYGPFAHFFLGSLKHSSFISCLLYGLVAGFACWLERESRGRIILCVVGAVAVVLCFVVLRSKVGALFQALLCGGILIDTFAPDLANRVVRSRAGGVVPWVLPIVLGVLTLLVVALMGDSPVVGGLDRILLGRLEAARQAFEDVGSYGIIARAGSRSVVGISECAYTYWALNYGVVALAMLMALGAQSVRGRDVDDGSFMRRYLLMLAALYMLYETFPTYLEFNPTILVLVASSREVAGAGLFRAARRANPAA